MICIDCGREDGKTPPTDHLTLPEVFALCKAYQCAKCSRTPEQIEADFERERVEWLKTNKPAHYWSKQ